MAQPVKITKPFLKEFYQPVAKEAHKGTQGHALLIGGSYGKMGSVCLSAKAALHSGCGLVTAFVPACGYQMMQVSFPEAMVITDKNEKVISDISYDFTPTAIGIGMGMGQEVPTQKAFHDFLKSSQNPLIIDADGLNLLSGNTKWLPLLPSETILTPHQKELERLIGTWKTNSKKLQKLMDLSSANDLIIVVKGAPTLIVYRNKIYENTTGNQALATAGSGDVLTGIITGLSAQGYDPLSAAILGVYLHGLTADIALPETGHQSFVASDIIRYLGKAFLTLD